jgi:diguanylate cyclase (GGDEF)-like protein
MRATVKNPIRDKILFLSIALLNVLYVFLVFQGHFQSIENYPLFLLMSFAAYATSSFAVSTFSNNFKVVPHFFMIFPMLALFDPASTSIIAYLSALFSYRKKYDMRARLYGSVQYAVAYYISGLVIQKTGCNWQGVILALIVFKVINAALVDLWYNYLRVRLRNLKSMIKGFFMELAFFSLTIPMVMVFPLIKHNMMLQIFVIYTLSFPPIFVKFISLQSTSNEILKAEKDMLSKSVEKLKRILEVSQMLKANMPLRELMMRVADIIHDDLGWEYVLVSMITPDGKVERIAYSGIDEKEFKRLKEHAPELDFIKSLMKEKYRVSNSYFIPEEAEEILPPESAFIGKYDNRSKDQSAWRDMDLLWIPITDRMGKMVALISPDKPRNGKRPTLEDITILEIFANQVFIALESSTEFEKLQEKAIRDGQTGLYNHTEFYNKLEGVIQKDEKFCLAMIDIDDFKLVNDTYGHQMGDEVIKYISDTIKRSIRHGDVAARYGGEEFAIIFKGMDKRTAKSIAERLRVSVSGGNSPVKVTISIGVACYPKDANSSAEIVAVADKALYTAKLRGKNMVVLSGNEKRKNKGI